MYGMTATECTELHFAIATCIVSSMACAKIEALPYAWPHDGALRPSNAALVVIDMQALLWHTPSKLCCPPTLAGMHSPFAA